MLDLQLMHAQWRAGWEESDAPHRAVDRYSWWPRPHPGGDVLVVAMRFAVVAGGKRGVHPRDERGTQFGCPGRLPVRRPARRRPVLASGREGAGGLDIWYSLRGTDGRWGDPVNFAAVNSAVDDFCPMAHRNRASVPVRQRPQRRLWGADIYVSRLHETRGWLAPLYPGCGINSVAGEASPSLTDTELYFSSTRAGGPGGSDIYVSALDGTSLGAPTLADGLNTVADDNRPNVRRDGLEIFFDSNRSGGIGGLDPGPRPAQARRSRGRLR